MADSLFFFSLYSVTMLVQWITWLDFLMGNPFRTPRINANWEWFGLLIIHWGVLPLCPQMKSPSTFPSWHFFVGFCSQDDAASFKALCNVSFLFSVLWKSLCKTGVFPPISVWKNSQRKLSEPGVIYFVPAGGLTIFFIGHAHLWGRLSNFFYVRAITVARFLWSTMSHVPVHLSNGHLVFDIKYLSI